MTLCGTTSSRKKEMVYHATRISRFVSVVSHALFLDDVSPTDTLQSLELLLTLPVLHVTFCNKSLNIPVFFLSPDDGVFSCRLSQNERG